MKNREIHTVEYLRECFDLDENTGVLKWKQRPLSHFKDYVAMRRWSGKWVGRVAGSPQFKRNGKKHVVKVIVGRVKYQAHRVVYAIHHGIHPSSPIDHINGDPHDNRPCNFRLASVGENAKNRNGINPRFGVRGVVFFKERVGKKPWMAQVVANDQYRFLGYYKTKGEAAVAYAKGSLRYHGKFSTFYRNALAT